MSTARSPHFVPPSQSGSVGRREFLTWSAAALAGATLSTIPFVPGDRLEAADQAIVGPASRKRSLRLAHMTDMHVQPELHAGEGMAAALAHAQSIQDPPQLILTGGDMVMDLLGVDAARSKAQWDVWQTVLKQKCSLPVKHCIGNHDVWGWNKVGSKTTGQEPGWGKQQAIDHFGLSGRYYSFDHGGWRFFVLDSVFPSRTSLYAGRLDDEQFAWLQTELKKVPAAMPVALVSHIHIVSVAVLEFTNPANNEIRLSAGMVHGDAAKIIRLLHKHPNVKLALSGHLHLTERIEYSGVTYLCGGAVCGGWWKGPHHGTPEGYLLVDLFDDGSVESRYVAYGWKARA